MIEKSYEHEIVVTAPPVEVYAALTKNINQWWTTSATDASTLGKIVTFHFDKTFKTIQVTELAPNRSITWKCLDNYIDIPTLTTQGEWTGSTIMWSLIPQDKGTRVKLSHDGLTPSLQCFDICVAGWERFFAGSLKNYLETGQGAPYADI